MLLHTGIAFAITCFFANFASAQIPPEGYNESISTDLPLPTLPDLDHYIEGLDVIIQADTVAHLQWEVPESIQFLVQDDYASYSAYCLQMESGNVVIQQQQSTSPVTVRPLGPGVPYLCRVSFNHILDSNRTEQQSYTFFTRQLAPTGVGASITDLKYARVNSTQVEFRWQGPSLADARGFPHYEVVIREGRMDSQLAVHDLSAALAKLQVVRNISVTDSTTTQEGLSSSITYTVQIRVFTTGGKGKYTYPLVVPCSRCTERIWQSTTTVTSGTLAALIICLAAISAMVVAAAVLLFVVAKAYRRKRRLAHATSEENTIVIREEQEVEEDLEGTVGNRAK